MRGKGRGERDEAHTGLPFSPVEVISSGMGAGVWVLDARSSRIEVAVERLGGFLGLRGQLQRFAGEIEMGPGQPPAGSLTIEASSVRCRSVWCGRQLPGREFFVTVDDPVVTFRSEHVLLVPPDQAWVTGTLARGGHSAPVAFEATVTLDFLCAQAVLDATVAAGWWPAPDLRAPRRRKAKAVFTLHLVFLRQY
jgi:polyisoprenoid-binding protein YceI